MNGSNAQADMVSAFMRRIKQELRLAMNGVASTQMREAGLEYHVNFGVELPRLQSIMAEIKGWDGLDDEMAGKLAVRLWSEDVRESKILACMLMPTGQMDAQLADAWVDEVKNVEIAQMACMFLFARLPFALAAAFVWIASDKPLRQVCGFTLVTRLLMQGTVLDEDARVELIDQCEANMTEEYTAVSVAARKARERITV